MQCIAPAAGIAATFTACRCERSGVTAINNMGLMNALTSEAEKPKCRVVIVGAGPAGLLAAINFLRREGPVEYVVDLVEAGDDYGALDAAGLEKHRSWMISLSTAGLTALRRVPG